VAVPFFASGTTAVKTDTRWRLYMKILGALQDKAGSNSSNNPSRTDTLRKIKVKILRSKKGTSGNITA
jgi:hypothetical protein